MAPWQTTQFFGDTVTIGLGSISMRAPVASTAGALLTATKTAGTDLEVGAYLYVVTYYNEWGESIWGTSVLAQVVTSAAQEKVNLTNVPLGPAGTVGRKIYRSYVNSTTPYYVGKIADNTTTTYTDSLPDKEIDDTYNDTPANTSPLVTAAATPVPALLPGVAGGNWGFVANVGGGPLPAGPYYYTVSYDFTAVGYPFQSPVMFPMPIVLGAPSTVGIRLNRAVMPGGGAVAGIIARIYRTPPGAFDVNQLDLIGQVVSPIPAGFPGGAPDLVDAALPGLNSPPYPHGYYDYFKALGVPDIVGLPRMEVLVGALGLPSALLPVWKADNPAGPSPAVPNVGTVTKFTAAGIPGTYLLSGYEIQVSESGANSLVGLAPYVDLDSDLTALVKTLESASIIDKGSYANFTAVPATIECQAILSEPCFQSRTQPTAPVAAPTLTSINQIAYVPPNPAPDDYVEPGVYKYKVAYVTSGPAGATPYAISSLGPELSVTVPAYPTPPPYYVQTVALGGIPVAGGGGVVGRRIYRTETNGSDFYLVKYIDNNTTTTWTDDTRSGDLGEWPDTPLAEVPGKYLAGMTFRNLVIAIAQCDGYIAVKALPRYWPVRGRYNINLQARSVDCAANGLNSAAMPVVLSVPIFTDVPITDWAWNQTERIRGWKSPPRNEPVTLGTAAFPSDSLPLKRFYAPGTSTKRYQMAYFIMRAKGVITAGVYTTQRFVDTGDTDANALFDLGISLGCAYNPATGQRSFCPNNFVTRAEMVTFLLRALGEGPVSPLPVPPTFADISGHWAQGMIEKAYAFNAPGDGVRITEGCHIIGTTKYFCPNDYCTRREMAVFLTRAFVVPVVPKGPSDPW
jgi:hypothetical protein